MFSDRERKSDVPDDPLMHPARRCPSRDVLVIPAERRRPDGGRDCNDVIVAFEVLSPSTEGRDLGWKRTAYASLPSISHYLVISQDAVDVTVFSRDDDFRGRKMRSPEKVIDLRSLGVSLPVAEIYRDTGSRREYA